MGKHAFTSKRDFDSKGRITLGASFANRTVIVQERGNEIVLKLVRVVPEHEAWLYENDSAAASVRRGLNEANNKTFAKAGPDLDAAAKLASQLQDE